MKPTALILLSLPAIGCATPQPEGPVRLTATGAIQLVTAESELFASLTHIVVGENGDVYVLDSRGGNIVVLDSEGNERRRFGTAGSGPGEFQRASRLALSGDTLRVIDGGNGRVQLFNRDGRYIDLAPLAPATRSGRVSYRADGWTAVGVNGFDSVMVAQFDELGEQQAAFGELIVPPIQFFDMVAIKNEVAAGGVPDAMRNMTIPVWAPDGGVWLVFQADQLIRRYDAEGTLLWAKELDLPEAAAIKNAFFERNRELASPSTFSSLAYFSNALEVNGKLLVLVNVPEDDPAVMLVIGPNGRHEATVVFPEVPDADIAAVDQTRGILYLGVNSLASLFSVELSQIPDL